MSVAPIRYVAQRAVSLLARGYSATGLIEHRVAEQTFRLAMPILVTSTLRTLLRTTDFLLVSIALDDAAVAALEFGYQYYFLTLTAGMTVSSGTISVVSRFVGDGDQRNADFTLKQSLLLVLAFAVPVISFTWMFAEGMLGILTDDPEVVRLGSTYLRIVMAALAFRCWSLVALRALQGAGDTLTPMLVRAVSLPTNIVLSAALIFGPGPFPALGIAGAAWGLVIAQTLASLLFLGVALSGRFAVRLRLRNGRWWDTEIVTELATVGYPLAGRRFVRYGVRFPFLFVLATLGTPVVAAFAVSRRIIRLARLPSNGFGTASSTLVGQELGAGEETEAESYGWQIAWISLLTQGGLAVTVMVTAPLLVGLFGVEAFDLSVAFVYVFGVATLANSVSRVLRGSLQAAGDTTWPFYGVCVGSGFRLALALLALPAGTVVLSFGGWQLAPGVGLGVTAIFAGILLDMYSRVFVNAYRYSSGAWKLVARRSPVGRTGD